MEREREKKLFSLCKAATLQIFIATAALCLYNLCLRIFGSNFADFPTRPARFGGFSALQ